MATIQPISTVTYNSEKYLLMKLNEWYNCHLISEWAYIKHIGEDGDKNHIHLRIVPNRRLDPMDLKDDLREYVPDNPKPLGCIGFRPSSESDWLLYVVHDKDYLKQKYAGGEKHEKIPYNVEDIKTSDGFMLEIRFVRAKAQQKYSSASIAKQLKDGKKAFDLILEGQEPNKVNAIQQSLYRNEYAVLTEKYNDLFEKHELLLFALERLGYKPEYKSLSDDGLHCKLIEL